MTIYLLKQNILIIIVFCKAVMVENLSINFGCPGWAAFYHKK